MAASGLTVRLITDGGFPLMQEAVGKTVPADKCIGFKGYNIRVSELVKVGMALQNAADITDTLYFSPDEVEVVICQG